jgi:hypothetical protein
MIWRSITKIRRWWFADTLRQQEVLSDKLDKLHSDLQQICALQDFQTYVISGLLPENKWNDLLLLRTRERLVEYELERHNDL